MRSLTRLVLLGAVVLALAASMAVSVGCGGSQGGGASPRWEEVVTSEVSGKAPAKLNLGTHELGRSVRLAWKLSGPDKPPVVFTLRIINADYGTGFGYAVTPQDQGFKLQTDNAITITALKPGNFTIFFSQRFPPAQGPGYDGQITVYTLK
jgi:hypothetical protein